MGEIAEVKLGKMLSAKAFEDGLLQLPYLRNQNVRWGHIDYGDLKTMGFKASEVERYSLEPGDLLVCEGGEPGRCAIYTRGSKELMYQKALHRIRPHGSLISPRFLQFCLWHYASNGVVLPRPSETTIQHLPLEEMQELPIPVAPIEEQRRIVREIEKHFTGLDAAVASLQRVQANLKRYRAAVLKAACEGRLVPTEAELARAEGRGYESAADYIRGLKVTDIPASRLVPAIDLPAGWAWTCLPQLGRLGRGKSKHRPRNDPSLFGGPYPFIQTGEVRASKGWIRSFDSTYNENGLAQSQLWPEGTLCITIAANIAETGILTFPACFPDSVVGLVHPGDPVTVRYTEIFLRTIREKVESLAPATAQKNINLDTLSEIPIPLPPIAEARRIVAEIDKVFSIVEETERTVEDALARAQIMRHAILQDAFKGRLVAQDPNDEPASVLLERIRQCKTSQPAKPRARKERAKPARAEEPPPPAEPEPEPQEADFLELPRDEQVDLVWETLLGQGTLEKDAAIRTVADGLRDLDLARFKRLRQDGPLYGAIAAAIEKGVREGDFDRPRRGCVRAVLADPKDYTDEVWQRCLLAVTCPELTDLGATLRAAAEWAREAMGLEYARLREDGAILTGLREALEVEVQAGRIVRQKGKIRQA